MVTDVVAASDGRTARTGGATTVGERIGARAPGHHRPATRLDPCPRPDPRPGHRRRWTTSSPAARDPHLARPPRGAPRRGPAATVDAAGLEIALDFDGSDGRPAVPAPRAASHRPAPGRGPPRRPVEHLTPGAGEPAEGDAPGAGRRGAGHRQRGRLPGLRGRGADRRIAGDPAHRGVAGGLRRRSRLRHAPADHRCPTHRVPTVRRGRPGPGAGRRRAGAWSWPCCRSRCGASARGG